jgi:thiol:disulfide interchange protein DsbD
VNHLLRSIVSATGILLPAVIPGTLDGEPVEVGPARVSLLAEEDAVAPGSSFTVGLHFELEEHWHVYWRNPGASGLPVTIDWDLPPGFEAGPIEWPAPEAIPLGGLVNYGYEDEVLLAVEMRAPADLAAGRDISLRAEADWLICKEACLPGSASLSLELPVRPAAEVRPSGDADRFAAARARLPEADPPFTLRFLAEEEALFLELHPADGAELPSDAYLFAAEEGIVDPNGSQALTRDPEGTAQLRIPLEVGASGNLPGRLEGVLQTSGPGGKKHWKVAVPLGGPDSEAVEAVAGSGANPATGAASSGADGFEGFLLGRGLAGWIVLAFLGGLILNVMPCVLPVLSLKVFSLLRHSGQSRAHSIAHGFSYTAGVVVSFLILASMLLVLRAGGEQIGWAFQLQNPAFVVVLAFVFFLFGLNLMGVFEIGTSLVGADSAFARRHDLAGSFGMGILAALVGAPCMGPLVASVSGIAIQGTAATGLLLFTFMGLGLASPFLFLAVFPKLTAFLPKPGAWMESLKQFMGFLLMAALLFLLWVLSDQSGVDAVIAVLGALLVAGLAAWVYGRWAAPAKGPRSRWIARAAAAALLLLSLGYGLDEARAGHDRLMTGPAVAEGENGWAAWSQEAVSRELAAGRPVFVDFTATWCLICQVNKKTVLQTEEAAALFEEYDVATLEADWTRADPEITAELEKYGRSGVPLYLVFSPEHPGRPEILPQRLSVQVIREALQDRVAAVALSQPQTNR